MSRIFSVIRWILLTTAFTSLHSSLHHDSVFFATAQPFCPMPGMIPGHELTSCKGYNGISSEVSCTRTGESECKYSSICLGLAMFSREQCGYHSCSYDKAAAAKCEKQQTDNPVTCKSPVTGEECTFDNRCFALHAGFRMQYCTSKALEAMCARDIEDWHECGLLKVKFKNPCLAIKAGFLLEKCERVKDICPRPDPTAICPVHIVSADVICTSNDFPGKCKYQNSCWADAAGYDSKTQCEPLTPTCPLPNEAIDCPRHVDPVECRSKAFPFNTCTFDNECLAEAAGYDSGYECKLLKDDPRVCSKVWKWQLNKCTSEEEAKLICGPNKCEYDNFCIAKAKGYKRFMCSPKDPTLPQCPKAKKLQFDSCKKANRPTICGDNKCQYRNKCFAESTGDFDPQVDCCNEPVLKNLRCPGDEEPVGCGHENKCVYRNRCFAAAAREKNCCRLVPEDINTQCTEYEPVTCGYRKCKYDSVCHANAVGATNCCTAPPETAICPEIYQPVKCGTCKYDNKCLAEAAGAKKCKPFIIKPKNKCPIPPIDSRCTKEYEPIKCGECEYANACLAKAAGAEGCPFECPKPPIDSRCTKEYEPIKCGECEYANACLAKAAGAEGCPFECPKPPIDSRCTKEYEPIKCGECEYGNKCLAKAARAENCSPVCPKPPSDTKCRKEPTSVLCGECQYANACLAKAAGAEGCPTERCPTPNRKAKCSKEYLPVKCGQCIYDNLCLAQSTDVYLYCPQL